MLIKEGEAIEHARKVAPRRRSSSTSHLLLVRFAMASPSAAVSLWAGRRCGLKAAWHPLMFSSQVTAIIFDKTGTLTQGKPEVTEVIPLTSKAGSQNLPWSAVFRF